MATVSAFQLAATSMIVKRCLSCSLVQAALLQESRTFTFTIYLCSTDFRRLRRCLMIIDCRESTRTEWETTTEPTVQCERLQPVGTTCASREGSAGRYILNRHTANHRRGRSTAWVKKSPLDFLRFFTNGLEFLVQIVHTYSTFLSTLDYKFLFSYVQLWRSYAKLSATTQFTPYVQNVHHRPKRTLGGLVLTDRWDKCLNEYRRHIEKSTLMFVV